MLLTFCILFSFCFPFFTFFFAVNSSDTTSPIDLCLSERKWWCFLLSSIFTFLAGIFIILIFRAFAFLCSEPSQPQVQHKQTNGKPKSNLHSNQADHSDQHLLQSQQSTFTTKSGGKCEFYEQNIQQPGKWFNY